MSAKRQWIAVGAIVAAVGGGIWAGVTFLGDEFAQVTVGSRAPSFRGVTADSVPVERSLADYAGQVTLVNIWATWCAPCEREMPLLQQLYDEFRGQGFRMVAVSVDSPGMEDAIRAFVDRMALTFDVIHDPDGRIKLDYMTTGVPESYIIGKDGVIRLKHFAAIKETDLAQLRGLVGQLLAEPAN